MNFDQSILPVSGWSFDTLVEATTKKINGEWASRFSTRLIREPLTMLYIAATLQLYQKGSRIGLSGIKIEIQEPTENVYLGIVDLSGGFRWFYGDSNDDLAVFNLCALKAAELHDLNHPAIRKVFILALAGLDFAKAAYESDPKTNKEGKTSPIAAIDNYCRTITDLLAGNVIVDKTLSDADVKVKELWDIRDIATTNSQIENLISLAKDKKPNKKKRDNIKDDLDSKCFEFNAICKDVVQGKLKIDKKPVTPPTEEDTEEAKPATPPLEEKAPELPPPERKQRIKKVAK